MRLETHHLVPLFAGGEDTAENRVLVTCQDHRRIHELRYHVYNRPGDRHEAKRRDAWFYIFQGLDFDLKHRLSDGVAISCYEDLERRAREKSAVYRELSPEHRQTLNVQSHHIVPTFDGGTDAPENLVCVTLEDHIALHFWRFLAYGKLHDRKAVELMRQNILRREQSIEMQKRGVETKGVNPERYCSGDHSERHRAQSAGGGLANTAKQVETRKKNAMAMKTYQFGKSGQDGNVSPAIANQCSETRELLKKKREWC